MICQLKDYITKKRIHVLTFKNLDLMRNIIYVNTNDYLISDDGHEYQVKKIIMFRDKETDHTVKEYQLIKTNNQV